MKLRVYAGLKACVLAAVVSGCATTEEANKAIQSKWIGQPADSFFTQYGPPVSSFTLNDGGRIYTWFGGEATRHIPAQYQTPKDANKVTSSKTETRRNVDGTTTTITRTSSYDIGLPPPPRMISPARTEQLSCEIQITTGADDVIRMLRATNDTDGEGLSFSRCAEVMGVKS
jgi:hypothetical protein